ncbi:MAG: hypothetical protein IPH65_17595 [Dehalococcoidia bacterium]|uniref:hypothetical protein n=1 Tax=Candidatus Amarobacter glycogenicus TaxID=3140699 RepID=UPI003134AEF0|nr:hypothetical protein [Dehalococcoidia bacterium]
MRESPRPHLLVSQQGPQYVRVLEQSSTRSGSAEEPRAPFLLVARQQEQSDDDYLRDGVHDRERAADPGRSCCCRRCSKAIRSTAHQKRVYARDQDLLISRGVAAAVTPSGTSWITTEPRTDDGTSANVTPGKTTAPTPMNALSPMWTPPGG